MDDPVLARMLDAALPFAAGRKLALENLPPEAVAALQPWSGPGGEPCTLVLAQSSERIQRAIENARGLVVLLLPGLNAPELPGVEIIDVQYAFEDETGIAEPRADASLPQDAAWPFARQAGVVHLDAERGKRPLGCIVIARVR